MGPRLVRALVRALLAVFYRRLEAVGLEHVPPAGPLLIAANHQNGLVDPMLLLATIPRPLQPVAKAALFRHPLIAPFLALARALPVERRQDPGADAARNLETFRAVTDALRAGGAILIFPEGVSQPEPTLMTLRTGTARMLLDAAGAGAGPVTLLPVGLVVHEPGRLRAGHALVLVGPPVPADDCIALHATDPIGAARRLTERLAEALRRQIIEAEDRDTLRLLRLIERLWREEIGGAPAASAEWLQRAARAYRWLRRAAPAEVARFRRAVEKYAADLERAGVAPETVGRAYGPRVVASYTLREVLPLVAGLPLALLGIVLHALPAILVRVGVRLARPDPDTEATYKLAGGLVIYPLAWLGEGWAIARVAGGATAIAFAAALLPAGFFALAWRQRLESVTGEARALLHFLARRGFHARLAGRRRALARQLERLATRVPEAVLAGDAQ